MEGFSCSTSSYREFWVGFTELGQPPERLEYHAAAIAVSSSSGAFSKTPGVSVLFVGNSLTYRGGGLDVHFAGLMPRFSCRRIVSGGATLAQLLERTAASLDKMLPDILVLQDDIPETTVDAFLDSALKYGTLARNAGVQTFFLMTWPYKRLRGTGIDDIAMAHRLASRQTGIPVIQVGLTWEACLRVRPDLDIFDTDMEHPGIAGSYLAACCVAEGLKNPGEELGNYVPVEISDDDAAFLRTLARREILYSAAD